MRPLSGKVALVAGGTRGSGRGIATELGAAGIAVRVDHLVPSEVEALVARIRRSASASTSWSTTPGAGNTGLRLLHLAVDTHLITAHHALPLMIENPAGSWSR